MPEPRFGSSLTVPREHDGISETLHSPQSRTSLNSPNSAGFRRKLVVIGDGSCGKTSMLISFTNGSFPAMYIPTVFENYVASIPVDDHLVELSLWDTAGQEDYDRLRPLSYPETSVILICFAIDAPNSLNSVANKWIEEVIQYCEGVPRILVGCKKDMREKISGNDIVSTENATAMAEKIQAYKYIECSAKTGEGLQDVFEQAARASLLNKKKFRKSQKMATVSSGSKSGRRKACNLG